jgi:Flp pilus assembly protein TadB
MKLDAAKEKLVDLKIERSRMNREESRLVIDKGISVYFLLLIIAVLGLLTKYLDLNTFVLLVFLGFVVLIITSIPYVRSMVIEKRKLNELISQLERKLKK